MVYRVVITLLLAIVSTREAETTGLKPAPKGQIWPTPQYEKKERILYKYHKEKLSFTVSTNSCKILSDAVDRARKELRKLWDGARAILRRLEGDELTTWQSATVLHRLDIVMRGPCGEYPYLGMDESYNLTVSEVAKLTSRSLWGALRGLESFVQLFYISDDYKDLLVNGTTIFDFPRFPHRGLLLDTARHFLPVPTIKKTLDAMAMDKLNVFHWHMVDDQSFPYQSDKFPDLSEMGAYHPTMVYTKWDIREIVNYARDRGIRVIPEMDIPGHTRSWGKAYPQLLTDCPDADRVSTIPLNLAGSFTYHLLGELFQEVKERFPDAYIHLGGDEVDLYCWMMNPKLTGFIDYYNLTRPEQFTSLFFAKLLPLLPKRSQRIFWQDLYDEGTSLPSDAVVQVWRADWVAEINSVLSEKLRVIHSAEWYLDKMVDWQGMYLVDPRAQVQDARRRRGVLGGEACMWTEHVDGANLISTIWPRASAVAERLWSYAFLDDNARKRQNNKNTVGGQVPSVLTILAQSPHPQPESVLANGNNDPQYKASQINPVSQSNTETKSTYTTETTSTFEPGTEASSTIVPTTTIPPDLPVTQTSSIFTPVFITNSTTITETSLFEIEYEPMTTSSTVSQTISTFGLDLELNNVEEDENSKVERMLAERDVRTVGRRLEEQVCRMVRRGVPVPPPTGPGFCVV